jgi:hypothetical protein
MNGEGMLEKSAPVGIFRNTGILVTVAVMACNLAGCSAIKGIFKAGVWAGIVVAAFVIMLVVGLTKVFSRR